MQIAHVHTTAQSSCCQVSPLTVLPTTLNGEGREKKEGERMRQRKHKGIVKECTRLYRGKDSYSGQTSALMCLCRTYIAQAHRWPDSLQPQTKSWDIKHDQKSTKADARSWLGFCDNKSEPLPLIYIGTIIIIISFNN